MDQTTKRKTPSQSQLEKLSSAEKLVHHVLSSGTTKSSDIAHIARLCKLTDLQVIVAIQLLLHKKMLPTEKLLF
jgi:hypothetical protein